jgi:radical SAM superfamily enzyme YgiQ (UPF0313 family)/methylase of polypeptide subunit release factors
MKKTKKRYSMTLEIPYIENAELKTLLEQNSTFFERFYSLVKQLYEIQKEKYKKIFLERVGFSKEELDKILFAKIETTSIKEKYLEKFFSKRKEKYYSKVMLHFFSKEHTAIKKLFADDNSRLEDFPEFSIATDWPDYGAPYIIEDIKEEEDKVDIKEDMVYPVHVNSLYLIKHIFLAKESLIGKNILEIGTGSGIIGIFLEKLGLKDTQVITEDINLRALDFEQINYRLNSIAYEQKTDKRETFDYVISIPPSDPVPDDSANYYSHSNGGGPDGLKVTKQILEKSKSLLKESGKILLVNISRHIKSDKKPMAAKNFEIYNLLTQLFKTDYSILQFKYLAQPEKIQVYFQGYRHFNFDNWDTLYEKKCEKKEDEKEFDELYLCCLELSKLKESKNSETCVPKGENFEDLSWCLPLDWKRPVGKSKTILLFSPPVHTYFENEQLFNDDSESGKKFSFPTGLATLASYIKFDAKFGDDSDPGRLILEDLNIDIRVIDLDYEYDCLMKPVKEVFHQPEKEKDDNQNIEHRNHSREYKSQKYLEIIRSYIEMFNAPLVGFSFYTIQANLVKGFISQLKEFIPQFNKEKNVPVPIVCGGSHVSFDIREFLTAGAKYVVFGDGEIAFEKIIKYELISEEAQINSQPNIFHPGKKPGYPEKIIENLKDSEKKLIYLDYLPRIYYCLFDKDYLNKCNIPIITSKGCCYNQCTFCINKRFTGSPGKDGLIYKNQDNVVKEVKAVVKYSDSRSISFSDEGFLLNKRYKDILEKLKENKRLNDLILTVQTRLDKITDKFLFDCKEYNIKTLVLGIESFDPTVLREVRKYKNQIDINKLNKLFDDVIKKCNHLDINVGLFLMFGLPGSEGNKDQATIKKIEELARKRLVFYFEIAVMVPYPGTEVRKGSQIKINHYNYEEYQRFGKPVYDIVNQKTGEKYPADEIHKNWQKVIKTIKDYGYENHDSLLSDPDYIVNYAGIREKKLFTREKELQGVEIPTTILNSSWGQVIDELDNAHYVLYKNRHLFHKERFNFVEIKESKGALWDLINEIKDRFDKKYSKLCVYIVVYFARNVPPGKEVQQLEDLIIYEFYFSNVTAVYEFQKNFSPKLDELERKRPLQKSLLIFVGHKSPIYNNDNFEDNKLYELKQILDRKNYNLFKSYIFDIIERAAHLSEIRNASQKYAISMIMARNMSHNIGSHVISNIPMEKIKATDKDRKYDVNILLSYLQQRMDLLARISTDWPATGESLLFLADLIRNFEKQSLLLDYIVRDEGIEHSSINIHCVVENDFLVQIPAGILGAHAFYVILENIMRNSVKYNNRNGAYHMCIYIGENNPNSFKLSIFDNFSVNERKHKSENGENCFLVEFIQEKLKVDFIDKNFKVIQKDWGIQEMKIASKFLNFPYDEEEIGIKTKDNEKKFIWAEEQYLKELEIEKKRVLSYVLSIPKAKFILCVDYPQKLNGELTKDEENNANNKGVFFVEQKKALERLKEINPEILYFEITKGEKERFEKLLSFVERYKFFLPTRIVVAVDDNEVTFNEFKEMYRKFEKHKMIPPKRLIICHSNKICKNRGWEHFITSVYKQWIYNWHESKLKKGDKTNIGIVLYFKREKDYAGIERWQKLREDFDKFDISNIFLSLLYGEEGNNGNVTQLKYAEKSDFEIDKWQEKNIDILIGFDDHNNIGEIAEWGFYQVIGRDKNMGMKNHTIFDLLNNVTYGFSGVYFLLTLIETSLTDIAIVDERVANWAFENIGGKYQFKKGSATTKNILRAGIYISESIWENGERHLLMGKKEGFRLFNEDKNEPEGISEQFFRFFTMENATSSKIKTLEGIDIFAIHQGFLEKVFEKNRGARDEWLKNIHGNISKITIISGRGYKEREVPLGLSFRETSLVTNYVTTDLSKINLAKGLISIRGRNE